MQRPIALFTDFGEGGLYVGQMKAVLAVQAPGASVIDLMADAPAFDPRASAYLLAALLPYLPANAVVLAVVDPGVGTARTPMIADADGRLLVGPDNGLFEFALRRSARARAWRIDWRPDRLSTTFHGRDLFAPVAARLAKGTTPEAAGAAPMAVPRRADWPEDWSAIIYIDQYGNAMSGLRATALGADTVVEVAGRRLTRATTFGAVPPGTAFWYENSLGLVEIAVNQGMASTDLGLSVGTRLGLGR